MLDFNVVTLKTGLGPSRSLEMSACDRLPIGSIVTISLSRVVSEIFNVENVMTLKSGSEVTQGH